MSSTVFSIDRPRRAGLVAAVLILPLLGANACSQIIPTVDGGTVNPSTTTPRSTWNHPSGVMALSVGGQDLPGRHGTINDEGNLVRSDGSIVALNDDIRRTMAGWLAQPENLAAAVGRLTCDLGADQPFLAVTMTTPSNVAQPIVICLEQAEEVPGGEYVDDLVRAIQS